MNKPLAHSYSAIKQFENCPKQYKMQRITREVKPSFGDASVYGSRIHEHLEERLKDKAVPINPEAAKYEPLVAAFEKLPGQLLVEQEMTLNADFKPTGWWDDDAWLRSKVDVMVLNGAEAAMGDWKTGKHRPDFTQLEMFSLQIFKHYPDVQRVTSSFIWLKDMKIDHETYMRKDEPWLWKKLLERIRRIEVAQETNSWPAKPSGLCPWCPAKHMCEFYHGK